MSEEIKGYVHSLESFGSVDGPGVRYVIFLSGCAMRCQFCHNPDTWKMGEGQQYTPSQLLKQALRYKNYWGNKGGITVSGGEPLLQIDFRMEEKQVNRWHLVLTRPTAQSRTDFLLPLTLLQNWIMKMLSMVSPILRLSTLMLWDTQKKNVQRTLFVYLTDTLIRVLITSTLTYSVKKN